MTPSRSEEIKIEISDCSQGARVLKLTGPLTLQTLFDFQETSRQDHSKAVIIDISAVPYMDSAGLGSVIGVFTSCQRINRGFGIVGVSERIRTLFKVTNVDGLLPCFNSLEEAEAQVAPATR